MIDDVLFKHRRMIVIDNFLSYSDVIIWSSIYTIVSFSEINFIQFLRFQLMNSELGKTNYR